MTPLKFTDSESRKNCEKAILVSAFLKRREKNGHFRPNQVACADDLMDELEQLAQSAGAVVVERVKVLLDRYNPGTLVGTGKVEEIHEIVHAHDADVVIFYNLLKPGQQKALEDALGVKVIDRKELILDIFAQRANTREGKLQVELAQLQYRLTRIVGKGIELSRTGGGIGTRGPGEKKLEVDRRRIRERITQIKKELEKVRRTRSLHHKRRRKNGIPVVSLVGYTNAGKSTLFNVLTSSSVTSKDQMFSTLDPTTRRVGKSGRKDGFLLVDTVGFIRDLPPELIEAFKATLEGITESDVILHVVDISSPFYLENKMIVEKILSEIGADGKPVITVYNKIDKLPTTKVPSGNDGELFISARKGDGIEELRKEISRKIWESEGTGSGSILRRF